MYVYFSCGMGHANTSILKEERCSEGKKTLHFKKISFMYKLHVHKLDKKVDLNVYILIYRDNDILSNGKSKLQRNYTIPLW